MIDETKRQHADRRTELAAEASRLLAGDEKRMRVQLEEWAPYDIAHLYPGLTIRERSLLLGALETEALADVISELDTDSQLEALQLVGAARAAEVLNRMENDDAADMLADVPDEAKEYLLSLMTRDESDMVRKLMAYGPETAGGLMTNRYVWFRERYTVREAVEKVKAFAELTKHVHYFYVVDEEKRLKGSLTYRDLVLAREDQRVADLMQEKVVSVPVDMDQEEVAMLFEDYDLLSVPVVDRENRLIGIVTVDDVIDVLREEANEDINKLSASDKTIDFRTAPLTAARRRLPWLLMLLVLGLVSGGIISRFERTLDQVVALTFFMPMIAGMTGNTGTQSLAVVVRGLTAQKQIGRTTIVRLLWRELSVGLLIGAVCGTGIAVVAGWWQASAVFGLVVGISLFLTIIIGTMAGTVIPLLLHRLKVDPAVASGPLITTLNDLFSLTVYFSTATVFLSYLT
ncbi:magnesium transporter [Paenibacillus cisolokensis]|uniref:Magnesium transporter MgtE n=1 Tax=Paenibacillus cisolokensis TaxID=1658519 RepID=A0ABQ4NFL0_9BACL|nr:magnesium transporter [Paenibacillus cisolokensis]GIQ67034.1 magnesium transporter MgtE [Paenibacillus cisolokensis]